MYKMVKKFLYPMCRQPIKSRDRWLECLSSHSNLYISWITSLR